MDHPNYVHEVFQALHAMPEIGLAEHRTSAFLADELEKYGYRVIRHVGGSTGVIGVLESGNPGPVLGLRADMDALAFEIDGHTEYRHACGHDAHSSMLMAAARQIAEDGIQTGKLYIIFQPGEETLYGALTVIDSGLVNDLDEIIGMHIRPVDDTTVGHAAAAMYHSAGAPTHVKIRGLTAHGARPHLGVNAVDAAVLAVNAINAIHGNPRVVHSLKVTQLQVGAGSMNIIPDEITMAIDIRCQDNDEMDRLLEKMRNAVTYSVKAIGAEAVSIESGYVPAAIYTQKSIDLCRKAIIDVLGEDGLIPDLSNPGGEDFHWFAKKLGCDASYIALGANASPGLHHKDMAFDHHALDHGSAIFCRVAHLRLG
ncbi:amidohydrolase [Acidaminobacterium chupaoyuni]